ncbi:Malate synthase [Orchesella cincta]|uniref:Malate synthase n=1 Tax=Orchesella cincta TaxID=48709 RepID=A0A1D2MWT6_ORCCI|nr:Malate synthase [Orchesella cincta]
MLSTTRLLRGNSPSQKLFQFNGKLKAYTAVCTSVQHRANSYVIFNSAEGRSRMSQSTWGREDYSSQAAPARKATEKPLQVLAPVAPQHEEILTSDALEFIKKLHMNFEPQRQELLSSRTKTQREINEGRRKLDFLESTRHIREDKSWRVGPLPKPMLKRRVEITGPVDRKMVINALNSNADCYMADFEDSTAPTWNNQLSGQWNLKAAIRKQIDFKASNGKEYKLKPEVATLLVRPRGWHLDEKHCSVDGSRLSGSLFDFGLYFYHNANQLLSNGLGPYFYLPKLQSHLEARLWNDVFIFAQEQLGIPRGTIKATVLIETIPAAFEMDEILFELKEHSAGLNAGRWDYIFSCIKTFQQAHPITGQPGKEFCFPDRSQITMNTPFMRAYSLSLVKTCHQRGAPAIGGMSALIPIKNDPEANEKAMKGIRDDKSRDVQDGFDGSWVAHPGLVPLALEEFTKVMDSAENQITKQRPDVSVTRDDLLNFSVEDWNISEKGLRHNIHVGIEYLAGWLVGKGCIPIFNLMEDAATAEISRSQVWQQIHSSKGVLEDGRKITADLVQQIVKEELTAWKASGAAEKLPYEKAALIFTQLAVAPKLEDFLTMPLYETF